MQEHQHRVYNIVLNMMQHTQDAEDITQDVFVAVFTDPGSFRGEAAVSTWLYRIAMNKCIDHLRKRKRQRYLQNLVSVFTSKSNVENDPIEFIHPGTQAENREKAAILYNAIQQLAINQRTAYVLCETESLSYKEIATIMDISVGAVESLLIRAKKNLRKIIATKYTGDL